MAKPFQKVVTLEELRARMPVVRPEVRKPEEPVPEDIDLQGWLSVVLAFGYNKNMTGEVRLRALEMYAKVKGWVKPAEVQVTVTPFLVDVWRAQLEAGLISLDRVPPKVREVIEGEYKALPTAPAQPPEEPL